MLHLDFLWSIKCEISLLGGTLFRTKNGMVHRLSFKRFNIRRFGRYLRMHANTDRKSWSRQNCMYFTSQIVAIILHVILNLRCTQSLRMDHGRHFISCKTAMRFDIFQRHYHFYLVVKNTSSMFAPCCRCFTEQAYNWAWRERVEERKTDYLIWVIPPHQMELASHITDAMQALEHPEKIVERKLFSGLCSAYRRFNQQFSQNASQCNAKLERGT